MKKTHHRIHPLRRRLVGLLLTAAVTLSLLQPFSVLTFAEDFYFGLNTLDGSGGNPSDDWLSASDPRYAVYGTSFALGAQATPYILKTGDELYSLSRKVNAGTSFEGKYLDAQGLSADEAAAVGGTYTTAHVLDLRMYDGSAQSAGATNLWVPIGQAETAPFRGHFYSSTSASIINLSYPYSSAHPYAASVYGLFGYNAGSVGAEGGFQVSAIHIATQSGNPLNLDFTANASSVDTIGGVAAVNMTGGVIADVRFGVGTNYDVGAGRVVENLDLHNVFSLPLNDNAALTVGGIAGYNQGTIQNGSFGGLIHSLGENGTGTGFDKVNGIGGIAGYSSGRIEGCVSDASITLGSAQSFIKVGGIAGGIYSASSTTEASAVSCVFTGTISVTTAPAAASSKLQNSVGGIAGMGYNATLERCVSGSDVTYACAGGETGRTGGIVGAALQKTVVSECFGTGRISGGGFTGGLAGVLYNTSSVKDSYYTGTVESLGYTQGEESKFGLSANNGVSAAGGLVGCDYAGTASFTAVSNAYFAGGTVNADIGSLIGDTAVTPSATLHYDCQVSPNAAVPSLGGTVNARTTAYLKTVSISDRFVTNGSAYPRLAWADSADISTDFGRLVKALAVVSSQPLLSVDASNSYGNGGTGYGSAYNAYQMKNSALNTGLLAADFDSAVLLGITSSGWTAAYTYRGGYAPMEELGALYANTVSVDAGRYTASVTLSRKLLTAVNQTEGAACSITNLATFQRMLDMANFASGGYAGGRFRLDADIDALTVSSVSDTADHYRDLPANYFCAEFDGNGKTIAALRLESGTQSLLRIGFHASVHDLNITSVTAGTADSPVDFTETNTGVLFARSAYTTFDTLAFGSVSLYASQKTTNMNIGVLSGVCLLGGNVLSGVTFGTVDVQIPVTMNGYSYGLAAANISGTGSRIDSVSVTNSYTLTLSGYSANKNQNNNKPRYIGGLFGTVAATVTLTDASVNNLHANIDAYEALAKDGSFGGIGGLVDTNVSNCTVTGKIVGPVGGGDLGRAMVGGISGAPSSGNKTYKNCHFTGELDGAIVGGIIPIANYNFKFESCSVTAAVNADSTVRVGAKKTVAGGITGNNTNNGITFNNCYFFGSITADDAGGLCGTAKANTIQNSYARAIVNSTSSSGSAGGLVGSAAGVVLTVKNSYFTGQLNGDGSKGGIAGKAAETSVFTNAYFDRSVAGSAIPTVASITQSEPDTGSALDAKCAVDTSAITAAGLSSSFTAETSTHYPQLSVYTGGMPAQRQSSDDSAQKVFLLSKTDATLTSLPDFDLAAGGDAYTVERQTVAADILKPWDSVLTYAQNGEEPYGHYAIKAVGSTQFTVKFSRFLPDKTLDLAYSVRVKPFDYGEGTADDPFIIYDTDELAKFRDYLKSGFDTALQYYKIGSLEAGHPAITLDLSVFEDWEPIINLAGHVDGNGSVLRHITCKQGYRKYDDSGLKVTETYYGFLGSTTDTGEVRDLTLDDVSIDTQNTYNVRAGAFIGLSAGGSYTNITATNVTIQTGGASSPNVGGLVGLVLMDPGRNFTLNQGLAVSAITGTGAGGRCGGLIGNNEGADATIVVTDSASYGTVDGYTSLGGIAGRVNGPTLTIDRCVSTMDLKGKQDGSVCSIGGLIGNSETAGIRFSLKDSVYGGRISYRDGVEHALGGLVGSAVVYKDFTGAYTFPSENDISFIGNGLYKDEQELRDDVYSTVSSSAENCYYNSNVNPYPYSIAVLKGRFLYMNAASGGNTLTEKVYDGELTPLFSGKSDTYRMTEGRLSLGDGWRQEAGYYPRPAWTHAQTDAAETQRDEVYLNDVSRFYSLGLYYTNAGRFGDDGFSNLFVTAEDIALQSPADGSLDKTANGKMLQSTREGAESEIVVSADYASGTFSRRIAFVPSVVSCGVADYSYYFANPQGMWITRRTDAGGIQLAYPWTIYTADQLQGLTCLTELRADGNGLLVDTLNYGVTPPSGAQSGDTFVLGADIDCGEAYQKGFAPVCPNSAAPFSTTLNGLGHTISGLYLNGSTGSPELGLFGVVENGEISNLGLVSGQVLADDTITCAGGLVARLGKNASVSNCFSAVPVVAAPDKTVPGVLGGLAGYASDASARILNSFQTGFVFSACAGDTAGGIIGDAAGASLENCYAAAYVEATNSGVVYGRAAGAAVINSYYDIGACGDMKNTGGAASQFPTAAALGRGFADVEGLYPLPVMFTDNLTGAVKAAAIPVSLTNARSVTAGEIRYPSAQLYYQNGYAGHTFTGTVGWGDTLFDEATPFTGFEKFSTGLAVLNVTCDGQARPVLANLQCWYDSGMESHRFVINTAKELAEFAAIVNGTLTADNNPNGRHEHLNITNPSFAGWTVTLGSDIDLSTVPNWTPIGIASMPFMGTFDGDGHVLSNITIPAANADGNAALFGTVENAVVTNTGMNAGNVNNAGGKSAALAAYAKGTTTISRCFSNVSVSGDTAAGICSEAEASVRIRECYNMGLVTGTRLAAGIAARNRGVIENSYNTGVVRSTTAASAGIAVENGGSITGCYNAAYVEGASLSPVADSGSITGSAYDPKLLTYDGQVAGVSKTIAFASGSVWSAPDAAHYPELNAFLTSPSAAFQDASELSVLKLDFGSGKYLEFVSASCAGQITTDGRPVDVTVTSASNLFSVVKNGDAWTIEPSKTGGGYIEASVGQSSAFTHRYYAVAVMLMKIRYEFDFSPLFEGNPALNPRYHDSTAAVSTWADNDGTTFFISSPEDFESFAAYVTAGNDTADKIFRLDYPLDMGGRTMAPIGTESTPFMGTFDGGGYTISNLNVTGTGRAALFHTIGTAGKIKNFMLDHFTVTAQKTNTAMYAACIAAENNGGISNVGITNGLLTASNAASSQDTYLGVFAAQNAGSIRGCYFIQNRSNLYGIVHYSTSNQYVGGMVGDNQGTLAGCYLISDMYTANIKAIAGSNGGKTDNIQNCYFNIKGTTQPVNLQYAFDTVAYAAYFVPEPNMKQEEFAKWLSSNIYAGAYKTGTVGDFIGSVDTTLLNDGLPYLTCTQLAKYDLDSYFSLSNSMMLSIWNVEESGASSFLNGVFALNDLDFKYFKSIVTHQLLRFDMSILPADIGYEIHSRVYGLSASYMDDVQEGVLGAGQTNVKDHPLSSDGKAYEIAVDATGVKEPNLVVVTIKLKKISENYPWGVYREWSAP